MWLPPNLYRKVIQAVPIICVDIVIRRHGQILLVKRANEPMKGEWFVPGGRILKGELIYRAVDRKAMEETGLTLGEHKFLGHYEDQYPRCAFGVPLHTVSLVFEAEGFGQVKLNDESTAWAWSEHLPEKLVIT